MERGDVSNKPSETIGLMAKYHKKMELSKSETYEKINEYMLKNYKSYNKVKWEDVINKYIDATFKKGYDLIEIEYIPVTDEEISTIKILKSKRLQRLAFTMLVIAKMNNIISDKNNSWVNRKDKEIFKHTNIRTSIKDQCLLLNDLKTHGLIEFSERVDNVNNRVLFVKEGEVVIKIDDMRNLGHQYDSYMGYGKYKKCEVCGETIKVGGNGQTKYCPKCYEEKHKNIDKEYQERKRKLK